MHLTDWIAEVASIYHIVDGLSVVDVRGSSSILVTRTSAIHLAITVEVGKLHPSPNLGRSPGATGLGAA